MPPHLRRGLLTCHVCEGGVLRPGGGAVAGPHREAGTRVRLRDVLLERSDAGEDNSLGPIVLLHFQM